MANVNHHLGLCVTSNRNIMGARVGSLMQFGRLELVLVFTFLPMVSKEITLMIVMVVNYNINRELGRFDSRETRPLKNTRVKRLSKNLLVSQVYY